MILIIDCGSSKTSAIKDVVSSLGFLCTTTKLSHLSPGTISSATGIIISGSPIMITESFPVLFAQKFSFLKNVKVPVLGICFGLQVMALVFDEKVFRGKNIQGEEKIIFHFSDALTEEIPPEVFFMESHTEGIELPDDDFFLLASSADYEVEAMKHKKKPVYGVQFHPEVSGEYGAKLLENFCKLCK